MDDQVNGLDPLTPEEQERVAKAAEDMEDGELAKALESMAEREAVLLQDPRLADGDLRRLSLHYLAALVAAQSLISSRDPGRQPDNETSQDRPGIPPSPE